MVKPLSRPYSIYNLHALELLGSLIHEARIKKALTSENLALRAGISRSLLQRIENGDPSSSIGAVFEVATICGIQLFDLDQRQLVNHLLMTQEKLTLLPKAVRFPQKEIKDDF